MLRRTLFTFLALAPILLVGCKSPTRPTPNLSPAEMRQRMTLAARQAGVEINTDQLVSANQAGSFVVAAPIRGLESVDPIDYQRGANVMFAYLDLAETNDLAPGYYVTRVFVDQPRLGTVNGTAQLLARGRGAVAERPVDVTIESLRVPPGADRHVTLEVDQESLQARLVSIHAHCSNGASA